MRKKNFLLKSAIVFAFLGVFSYVKAQEQLGLRFENYSGAASLALNPASVAASYPLAWDLNLASAGIFASNNILYYENASLFKAFSASDKVAANPSLELGGHPNPTVYYNFFNDNKSKYVFASSRIDLPSFVMNFESGHSIGFVSALRLLAGSPEMPALSNYYLIKQASQGQTLGVDPFQMGGMSWAELGLNYAYRASLENGDGLAFGLTVKYLMPNQGISINNYTTTRFGMPAAGTVRVDTANVDVAFTSQSNNGQNIKGNGLGIDVGAMWVSKPDDEGNYEWKLGFSFLDIGSAKFTAQAETHRVKNRLSFTMTQADLIGLSAGNATTEIFRRISERTLGGANQTQTGTAFSLALPTAMCLQGEYRLSGIADDNLYVGGIMVQRLVRSGSRVITRPNIVAVTPRWETRWFSVMMPLSVLEWRKFNVGLSGRVGFLVLGSDNLLSFFPQKELESGDFYIGFRLNPFNKGRWNSRDGGGGMRGRSKRVNCFRF
jgi:hypothetical protein